MSKFNKGIQMSDKINGLRPMKYYPHKSVDGSEIGFFADELTNDDIEILKNFDEKDFEKILFRGVVNFTNEHRLRKSRDE
jgi:hypothetical protein